jgi:hypothetical protein
MPWQALSPCSCLLQHRAVHKRVAFRLVRGVVVRPAPPLGAQPHLAYRDIAAAQGLVTRSSFPWYLNLRGSTSGAGCSNSSGLITSQVEVYRDRNVRPCRRRGARAASR